MKDSAIRGALLVLMCLACGCHLDMYDQPKYKPLAADPFFADSASERMPVEGTLASNTYGGP